jgi:hypothetical protein
MGWLVTGRTVGGLSITPAAHRLDRETALRLYTEGSAWFSSEAGKKGVIKQGQLADLALLSADMMRIPEDAIRHITSVLTIVNGRIVHGEEEFASLAPPAPRASPDWSPVNVFGGYYKPIACCEAPCAVHRHRHFAPAFMAVPAEADGFWGALGCSCWI